MTATQTRYNAQAAFSHAIADTYTDMNLCKRFIPIDINWSASPIEISRYMVADYMHVELDENYFPVDSTDVKVMLEFLRVSDAVLAIVKEMKREGFWDHVLVSLATGRNPETVRNYVEATIVPAFINS
jgi:hypothetical protein